MADEDQLQYNPRRYNSNISQNDPRYAAPTSSNGLAQPYTTGDRIQSLQAVRQKLQQVGNNFCSSMSY